MIRGHAMHPSNRATGAVWRLAILAFAFGLLTSCATTPAPTMGAHGNAARIERVSREFALDKSIARVEIVNRYGEISVHNQDDDEVGIHAVIQRLPPDFPKARFVSHRDKSTLHIETGFPAAPGGSTTSRVDIAVYLPSTRALALVTRDGRISVKRREGSIEARSEAGAILAASRGRLDLATGSGQIRATEIGKRWSGTSRIETGSGRIILLVPTFGDIALDAETGGHLTTDFGVSVHQHDGRNSATARYGSGTSPLIVRSKSGQVMLEQLVLMGEDGALPEDDD